jgi:hypothetical protein
MRSTLLLCLSSVLVVGCGDHNLPPGQDMAAPEDLSGVVQDMPPADDQRQFVSFTMFAQHLAETLCAHALACGQLDAAQMSACIERNLRGTGWDQDVEIMKGRMEINELQCLDAIKNSRCDLSDVGYWSTRCNQFLYLPHQASGSACLSNDECTTGFCQHGGSDGGMAEQVTGCPGTCAAPKGTGVTCRQTSDCASDSYCDRFGTQTCLKSAALNEDCTAKPCQFGLACPTFPATLPKRCVLPATQTTLHGACDPFQGASTPTPACGAGMYCQLQYTTGAACTGATGDCASPPGSYCDTTAGMCQNPSGGKCESKIASGANCDPNNTGSYTFVDNQCIDGTTCYKLAAQASPRCQTQGSLSGACVKLGGSIDTCKVGLYCNAAPAATEGTCVTWFADGQTCDTSSHCPSSSAQNVCIVDNPDAGANTTCEVTRSFGKACTPGFEDSLCAQSDLPGSTYCAPTGSSGVCAPKCF